MVIGRRVPSALSTGNEHYKIAQKAHPRWPEDLDLGALNHVQPLGGLSSGL